MGELEIQLSAVTLDQAEGVQLAESSVVEQGAEVSPIDLEALASSGLHAHIGAAQNGVLAHCLQIVLQDGDAAVIPEGLQSLKQDRCWCFRILLQQFRQSRLESIELAETIAAAGRRCRLSQVLGQRMPADVEMGCDSALRPFLDKMQAVNLADLFRAEHRQPLYTDCSNKMP